MNDKFKKITTENYEILPAIFNREFGDGEWESITSDESMVFLKRLGKGVRQAIKKFRWVLLMANSYLRLYTID